MPSVILVSRHGQEFPVSTVAGFVDAIYGRGAHPKVGSVRSNYEALQVGGSAPVESIFDAVTLADLQSSTSPAGAALRAAFVPVGDATKRLVRSGVFVRASNTTGLADFAAVAGESPSLFLTFPSYVQPLDVAGANALHAAGITPVLGWMPQDGSNAVSQPNYQLADIIAGTHDAYMTTYLTAVKNLGYDVVIRWGHEMNGNWYNWSEQVNGNQPGEYVQAWRHVVDLARSLGVTNVRWCWAVNAHFTGSPPLAPLYPGDDYVDIVGVQGYNTGVTGTSGAWRSPAQIFDTTLTELNSITTSKPIWITETGCGPDDGGSKVAWFGQFFDWLAASPVSAFIYFNENDAAMRDWRITTPSAAAPAFTAGMAKLRRTTRATGSDTASRADLDAAIGRLRRRLAQAPGAPTSLWAGGHAETISRLGLKDINSTSGRLELSFVTAPAAINVKSLAVSVRGAASGVTLARLALFTVADNGDVTKVAQTAASTTLGTVGFQMGRLALDTANGFPPSYTLEAGKRYAFAWLIVATTPGAIRGQDVDFEFLTPVLHRTVAGQTDIAAGYTNAQQSNPSYQPRFVAGINY